MPKLKRHQTTVVNTVADAADCAFDFVVRMPRYGIIPARALDICNHASRATVAGSHFGFSLLPPAHLRRKLNLLCIGPLSGSGTFSFFESCLEAYCPTKKSFDLSENLEKLPYVEMDAFAEFTARF
jgi:hypothetical protein